LLKSRAPQSENFLEQAIPLEELAEAKRAGKFEDCLIRLENLLPNFPRANVLPVIEKRVRHGSKFNILIAQIQTGPRRATAGRNDAVGWRRAKGAPAARLQPAR